MYHLKLGVNLKQLRKARHLTQQQLADSLGVTKSIISAYENGARYPSYDILLKLISMFGVSTDFMLGLDSGRTIDVSDLSPENIDLVTNLVAALRAK